MRNVLASNLRLGILAALVVSNGVGWTVCVGSSSAGVPDAHVEFESLSRLPAAAMPDVLSPSPGESTLPNVVALSGEVAAQPYCTAGSGPGCSSKCTAPWCWQVLPDGLIYRSYLAGVREPRIGCVWAHEQNLGWMWDIALGGRAGLLRYGSTDAARPEGWQVDLEGAGLPRLDIDEDRDLVAADFRFGVPLTYGRGRYQTKLAFYHLSSHLGDEFMNNYPNVQRVNYSRDVIVWGHSYYLSDDVRIYGEAGWAFRSDVSEPWEFQLGLDYSPTYPSGICGAPFFAVNGHLREEVNFGGNLVVQAGWQWRGFDSGRLMRVGLQYFNGNSEQYEFYNQSEQKLGAGVWYDF